MKLRTFALVAMAALIAAPIVVRADASERQTYDAATLTTVRITTAHGDYEGGINAHIVAWNHPQVAVTRLLSNLKQSDVVTDVRRQGNVLQITTAFHGERPRAGGFFGWFGGVDWQHHSVTYDIFVPSKTRIALEIANGNATIEGVAGPIEASAENGNLSAHGTGGAVHLDTNNGDVEATLRATTAAPSVELDTNNGNIALRVPAGFNTKVVASVSNGDVKNPFASATGPGTVSLSTNNGDITVSR
jgi:hypothetical protein